MSNETPANDATVVERNRHIGITEIKNGTTPALTEVVVLAKVEYLRLGVGLGLGLGLGVFDTNIAFGARILCDYFVTKVLLGVGLGFLS